MASVYELLRDVTDVLDRLGVDYFVTGSLASMNYGELRFTHDIDMVIRLRLTDVDAFVDAFAGDRFYLDRGAVEAAVRSQGTFNLIDNQTTIKVDFILPSSSHDRYRFDRRRKMTAHSNVTAYFSSPEDVIISKLQYHQMSGSDKHLRDIGKMLEFSGDELDYDYLSEWTYVFDVHAVWKQLLEQTGRAES